MDSARMKIYFCGSIRGGRDDQELYYHLIEFLKTKGEVLTEHIGDKDVAADHNKTDREIYLRDMHWLDVAEIVVAEVSTPSLGVGFEIARALHQDKKILCLSQSKRHDHLSALISGCPDLPVFVYSDLNEAQAAINDFISG